MSVNNLGLLLKNMGKLEQAWQTGYAAPEHDALCQLPMYLAEEAPQNLWRHENSEETARAEGNRFKQAYFEDAQFVFSRRQHRWHKHDNKTGQRVPLFACRITGPRKR